MLAGDLGEPAYESINGMGSLDKIGMFLLPV